MFFMLKELILKSVDFKGLGGGQTELFHITENNQTEKENVCQKESS